ncbi:salicylate 1-monooxygenase [Metarhizium robertsii ARSEF 23]|uniref:Salicylate 1-monooxygenase n=1 Tax=Metarhizium robertsii (strain ARSEF 23 / ATCC MYA-3075) TaxID=655844 RepID=E9ESQ6_METRA|nr:salicylate 1-monooxygenase [Metarhizium robertsii ARSEF 23]EFZ01929.1 salicylate 1-monooxygenase [Metarhizium robertsii ARSEF 23]
MSPAPTVLIIGCGVAGPVLGNLLIQKGYHPIVFEKVSELGDAGASLMLMSNGLKVLELVGVADNITAESYPIQRFIDSTSDGKLLGSSDLPSTFKDKYGHPLAGIKRTSINLMLKKTLLDRDIEVREGWELLDIEEKKDSVTAYFNHERAVTASFLIGCDGIKSASRRALLRSKGIAEGLPSYTGLTQTAGISKVPDSLLTPAAMRNWYGDGTHVIAYPISKTHISWAITRRETNEAAETWRPYRQEELPEQKSQLSNLPSFAREDCFHLSQALPDLASVETRFEKAVAALGPSLSDAIFKPYAEKRQPRTSHLVRGARAVGEQRTASGEEACALRDGLITEKFADEALLASRMDELLREPFQRTQSPA